MTIGCHPEEDAKRRREDHFRGDKNLLLRSTFRIFNFVLDTVSRHNQTKRLLLRSTFRIFGYALDAHARQCSNKFDIALVYSYLC